MRKLATLALAIIASTASAQLQCFYKDLVAGQRQQVCFDMSKPREAQAAQDYIRSLQPRAGIFDNPITVREMLTARHLTVPAKITPFRVSESTDGLIIKGIMNGGPEEIKLSGIVIAPGQEVSVARLLGWLVPPASIVNVEATGEYSVGGQKEVFLWLGNNLINIILVERGLALPIKSKGPYEGELASAAELAKTQRLGMYAESK
ncbi:hypothetical protein E5F05_19630 [Deinococcus metallilatus]|uniref:TNase-like domain-containing protein n=1 Tax=Deinococcus metallilatus TaxID=1211322 RepID=A0AAJ5K4G1_9DEIO|nr:hypothetical protein [Deinococcus metallilatus]MBB5296366.1 hypothetical protein [Deinococcus metallilatus]QBY09957.1 hypothetical protein E5F05_19630 [Deinococcus metallilatus]RXJ08681.1 hypothetical protein ERJ73_18470 [Deinococcus metallilatus]TLK25155.1 hypothetical protein FCS05_13385 [Deinococcus metallilatus]